MDQEAPYSHGPSAFGLQRERREEGRSVGSMRNFRVLDKLKLVEVYSCLKNWVSGYLTAEGVDWRLSVGPLTGRKDE